VGRLFYFGEGGRFPGIGPLPPFWSLMVSLGTFKVTVGVSFCWYVTVSVYWSSRSSGSLLVCHLGPIWFWYVVFLGYVTLLKVVPCSLPSCFSISQFIKDSGHSLNICRINEWIPKQYIDSFHLLQCMKVKSESEVAQSCPTLCDLMDCSPPGSPIHGIFQARVLEWGAIAFSCYWSVYWEKVKRIYVLLGNPFIYSTNI